MLRRRSARKSLTEFARYIDVPGASSGQKRTQAWQTTDDDPDDADRYAPVETLLAQHHELMLSAAERCINTPYGRLMLFMPPGSAKSTYGSVIVPSYAMGKVPGFRVIAVSYGSDLARKLGRKARAVVRQPKFKALFDTEISAESSAADEWALANGSEYMAGGLVNGAITGNRANLVVVDDPIKGRSEAESDIVRQRVAEAFDDDVKTRLLPGGSIIIIQTRWHEEDLAGSILPLDYAGESGIIHCRDGQDWEVICLPAMAERADDPLGRKPGEYLWPEWFDRRHWAQFENKPRTWASLFQQRPAPEEGDLFQRSWLRYYNKLPARSTLTVYGASDYAVTADGGDYTVHIVVGIDVEGRIWILDLWRDQTASDVWIETFCDLVKHWNPMGWAEETGQIKASLGPFITRRQRERGAYVARETFPTRGDKAVRAQSIRGRMALDGIYVPGPDYRDKDGNPCKWVEPFIAELLTFPTGRNDDQVDALGLIGQLLDKMFKNPTAKEDEPKKRTEYVSSRSSETPEDWKVA